MLRMMFVLMIFIISNLLSQSSIRIIQPEKENPASFAVIIDRETFDKTENEVLAYRDAVESDGLSTYILINDWTSPDQIKSEIVDLYHKAKNFEGIVLIGDIPIPMIRNAQHMTSAFKLDEARYPWFRSSVASDRFYDDFDLQFDYLGRDSVHTLCYYYSLKPESPQRIEKDIYSGRIMPPFRDESKYGMIKTFLKKVVKVKNSDNELNNMFVFTGQFRIT